MRPSSTVSTSCPVLADLTLQFVPGKALPGGAEGVCQLAECLDMGAALVVRNLDLKSLQDPKALPEPIAVKKPQVSKAHGIQDTKHYSYARPAPGRFCLKAHAA